MDMLQMGSGDLPIVKHVLLLLTKLVEHTLCLDLHSAAEPMQN